MTQKNPSGKASQPRKSYLPIYLILVLPGLALSSMNLNLFVCLAHNSNPSLPFLMPVSSLVAILAPVCICPLK